MDTSPNAELGEAMAEIETLKAKINLMQREFELEQNGAFAFITALVLKLGGNVELSNVDMMEACEHEMERAQRPDGGFILRASKPIVAVVRTLARVQ